MGNLVSIIGYILEKYSHKDELSNARVTKMVYLADWYNANKHREQITDINWYFDNYGPFVPDVLNTVKAYPKVFSIEETHNTYGGNKNLISLVKNDVPRPPLNSNEIEALNTVIKVTEKMNWNSFIKFVYSTHPIISSNRYSRLDLVEKANEYQAQQDASSVAS